MKKLFSIMVGVLMIGILLLGGLSTDSSATVTVLEVYDGTYLYIANVTYSAGTDTFGSITHGITLESGIPPEVTITPLDANCFAGLNASGIVTTGGLIWNNPTTSGTAVQIVKPSTGPSATCAVRVTIRNPHSIIR